MFGTLVIRLLRFACLPILSLLLTAGSVIAETNMAQTDLTQEGAPHAVVAPSRQELLYRVQYWEGRGRSDLAEKARMQLEKIETKSVDATVRSVSNQVDGKSSEAVSFLAEEDPHVPESRSQAESTAADAVSSEALVEQANYWETRGRTDLAEQIRQKLQVAEKSRPAVVRASRSDDKRSPEQQPLASRDGDVRRSALEDALLKNPSSLKTRLDLAQIYRDLGEYTKARIQVESVLQTKPDLADALYASAQLYGEQSLWMETLHTLEKISPVARTADMASLQKSAWAHVQLDRADALTKMGRNAEAEVLLRQVALELSINTRQEHLAEPPSLWKAAGQSNKRKKSKKD